MGDWILLRQEGNHFSSRDKISSDGIHGHVNEAADHFLDRHDIEVGEEFYIVNMSSAHDVPGAMYKFHIEQVPAPAKRAVWDKLGNQLP